MSGTTAMPNVPEGNVTMYYYSSGISLFIDQWMDEFYGSLSYNFGGSYVNVELSPETVEFNQWNHLVLNKGAQYVQTWLNGALTSVDQLYTGNYNGQINPDCYQWGAPLYSLHGDTTSCWHEDDFYIENILTQQSNSNLYATTGVAMEDLVVSSAFLLPEEIEALSGSLIALGLAGCLDPVACNFNPNAVSDDASCQYSDNPYADCDGNCFFDEDGDGICDQLEIGGCTDSAACNYDPYATEQVSGCIPGGCTDSAACNFVPEAFCDNGSCDYTCCPGPGCCDDGMYWDSCTLMCKTQRPSDVDSDGCTGVGDVLEVLANFGGCSSNYSLEPCSGNTLEYNGYEYVIVEIGNQWWFAENLKSAFYSNGDPIPGDLSGSDWNIANYGAQAVHGEIGAGCSNGMEFFDSCNPDSSLAYFGRLYNHFAVADSRGLCPVGWHVSSNDDWNILESFVASEGFNGEEASELIEPVWWGCNEIGSNSFDFNAELGGSRTLTNNLGTTGAGGFWWTSSLSPNGGGEYALGRFMLCWQPEITQNGWLRTYGYSIRCVKD